MSGNRRKYSLNMATNQPAHNDTGNPPAASGTTFSRKEFLGLLGGSAGALILPPQVSAHETAADSAAETGLPPLLTRRKTRIRVR